MWPAAVEKRRDHAPPVDDALDRAARRRRSSRGGRPGPLPAGRGSTCRRAQKRGDSTLRSRVGVRTVSGPPGGRNDRELVQPVVDELVGSALHVGDQPAVRAPREAAVAPLGIVVRALEGRQLAHRGAGARLDREHVPVVGAVRIRPALGDERDRPAVGRPGREQLVVAAGRQGLDLAGVAIDQVEMLVPLDQVPVAVELELEAVDHDRLLGLRLLRALLVLRRLRVGIVDHEHQALAVRRPVEVLDVPLHLGELFRLAARIAAGSRAGSRRSRRRARTGRPGTGRPGSSAATSRIPCPSSGARFPCRPSSSARCGSRACLP